MKREKGEGLSEFWKQTWSPDGVWSMYGGPELESGSVERHR